VGGFGLVGGRGLTGGFTGGRFSRARRRAEGPIKLTGCDLSLSIPRLRNATAPAMSRRRSASLCGRKLLTELFTAVTLDLTILLRGRGDPTAGVRVTDGLLTRGPLLSLSFFFFAIFTGLQPALPLPIVPHVIRQLETIIRPYERRSSPGLRHRTETPPLNELRISGWLLRRCRHAPFKPIVHELTRGRLAATSSRSGQETTQPTARAA
jgi:hypothetical protein